MVHTNWRDFARRMDQVLDAIGHEAADALRPVFIDFGARWADAMRQRVQDGPGALAGGALPPGQAPRTRSGALRRSFRFRVTGKSLDSLRAQMFSTRGKIAAAQEFGTKGKNPQSPIDTIRPKRAKYLTIPLPGALTKSGRPRFGLATVGDWINQKDAFFLSFGEQLLLVMDEGPAGDIVPLFVLKKSVDLYPRLGMRAQFTRQLPAFRRDVETALRAALKSASRKGGK